MSKSPDALRRWFGLLFLALAFGLLIWGQIVLGGRLRGVSFLAYWGLCFLFTIAAIVTALLDVRATRKRAQQAQRDLLERTMQELERDSGDDSKH